MPVELHQSPLDKLPLHVVDQVAGPKVAEFVLPRDFALKPSLDRGRPDYIPAAEHSGSFTNVFEFTHVAGPVVVAKHAVGCGFHLGLLATIPPGDLRQEVVCQHGHVVATIP